MPRTVLLVTTLLVAGCGAGWHEIKPSPTTVVPPRQQVLVYHAGALERWHAVRFGADSVSGIHWLKPIEGDTGRVALPLASIDSLRAGDPATGFVKSYFFSVYVIAPVALVTFCIITRSCPAGD